MDYRNTKLDTPEGFFWLWERFQKQKRWDEFLAYNFRPLIPYWKLSTTMNQLINPLRFRDAVAEFFGWEEGR